MNNLSKNEVSWFDINENAIQTASAKSDWLIVLGVNLSLNRTIHKRSIYSFLDLLADVGGCLHTLRLFGGIVMTVYTYIVGNPLSIFLVNQLFKRRRIKGLDQPTDFDKIK